MSRTSIRHLAITPKALNSKAQRRAAHAGLRITHMTEPQRGSTKGAGGAEIATIGTKDSKGPVDSTSDSRVNQDCLT